jgi:hypothetical protein
VTSSPDDVLAAATLVTATLAPFPDDAPGWAAVAAPTSWTAARTVDHVVDSLLFYAGQVARRALGRHPPVRDGGGGPASALLDRTTTAAHVLAGQLRDLGTGRAWHPSGLADAAGWAGMAVTEVLVHGHDAARALGADLVLPDALCARTVARVFPWVDPGAGRPSTLLLAVTGRLRVEVVVHDPDWWWQSAPLAEWDGRPRRRTVPPGWR